MKQDLMGFLYDEFKKQWDKDNPPAEGAEEGKIPTAAEFLGFARKYLNDNPPVAFDYVNRGLGVTLRNSQYCTFLQLPDVQERYIMHGGEIPVTDQNRDINTTNMFGVKV